MLAFSKHSVASNVNFFEQQYELRVQDFENSS